MGEWKTRDDPFGIPCAIELDGYTIIHLQPGTVRNHENLGRVVALLNDAESLRDEVERLKGEEARIIRKIRELSCWAEYKLAWTAKTEEAKCIASDLASDMMDIIDPEDPEDGVE